MSTDVSDSRGSHCSDSLSPNKKKLKKPPFNRYFAKCQPLGRSDFCVSKLAAKFITPKFYSRGTSDEEENQILKETVDERKNVKDSHCFPLLNSQSYGWWYDRHLGSNDSRFNFHRNTSDMVRTNIMIQREDQKLRGLFR